MRLRGLALCALLLPGSLLAADYVTHLTNIYRAPIELNAGSALGMQRFFKVEQPVAVGGYGQYLFFAGANGNTLYRYHLGSETIKVFDNAASHLTGNAKCIVAQPNLSFYVCDPLGHKLVLFDQEGRLVRRITDFGNMAYPVGLIADAASPHLIVADGQFDHLITFSRHGKAIRASGERGLGPRNFMEVVDIAEGEEGIYVLDRINKYLKVLDRQGRFVRSQTRHEVSMPTALAVDYGGRIYISDEFDDTIRIYDRNGLLATIGGTGMADGRFRGISDMLIKDNFLYVADSGNNRIQVFVIAPYGQQP